MPERNGRPSQRPMPVRERLEELLNLAQTYRGWTLRELSSALDRDPHKLIPTSGVPKLDIVMRLADVLDWSVEDVTRSLCGTPPVGAERCGDEGDLDGATWSDLDRAAFAAYEENRYGEMARLARAAHRKAETPDQRAKAVVRECLAWDGLGRYGHALECARRGLRETAASLELQLSLRANLANAHYALGNVYEGEALANSLVSWFAANPPPSPLSTSTRATALYVRGSCHRTLAGTALACRHWHAERAHEDLRQAEQLFDQHAKNVSEETYAGNANVCRGGAMEMAAFLGLADPDAVLDRFVGELEQVVTPRQSPRGSWLESWGWWCIFGCNVAIRHLGRPPGEAAQGGRGRRRASRDAARLQAIMAKFTSKADEIAERLGNWSLRERVWTMEVERRRLAGNMGINEEWMVDVDDVRVVAGAMARFPAFREAGWQVLRTARRIGT